MSDSSSLGVVLNYGANDGRPQKSVVSVPNNLDSRSSSTSKNPKVSFIGAGNYAKSFLIPSFIENKAILHGITSRSGFNSSHLASKFGFKFSAPDTETLFADASTDIAVIATRHDTHAEYICDALSRNLHVFVEKPLAISKSQLNQIIDVYEGLPEEKVPILTVGFNRRFSPHARTIKRLLDTTDVRKSFVMTVNAGEAPADSWIHDKEVGGGRVIGEVCHFIDLLRYLSGYRIVDYDAVIMDSLTRDTLSVTLKFLDGSIGTIHYFSNGHKDVPKERLEIFCGSKILFLDNFRKLTGFGWKGFKKQNLRKQDKGQFACVKELMQSVQQSTQPPISIPELIEVTEVSIEIQSLC
ncbi:MAG: Gfo/Idh/MocA family oxidoreductase [Gammaproteobacteria bacterium]